MRSTLIRCKTQTSAIYTSMRLTYLAEKWLSLASLGQKNGCPWLRSTRLTCLAENGRPWLRSSLGLARIADTCLRAVGSSLVTGNAMAVLWRFSYGCLALPSATPSHTTGSTRQ